MTWKQVLLVASAVEVVALLLAGAAFGDAESLAFALGVGVSTAVLIWRPSRLAMIVRFVIFSDVVFFMLTGWLSNIGHHEQVMASLVPIILATTSTVGLVATAVVAVDRREAHARPAPVLAAVPAVLVIAGLGMAALNNGGGDAGRAGDLHLTTKNATFSSRRLAANAGTVSVDVTNADLFWHTFTIDGLHVDDRIPVQGHHRVSFTAAPGTYRYYCAIPGHAAIGMSGTLVIR